MPDPENPPNPAPSPAPNPDPPTGDPPETDWKAEAEKWKGLARKHEDTSKANAAAAKRLEEMENANKSEIEKVTAARDASDKEATTARLELTRMRVAVKKGLTESQAKRLVGTTEEELEADAEELLTTFKPAEPPSNGNGNTRPRENLRPGAKPDAKPEEMDPVKLAEAVPR